MNIKQYDADTHNVHRKPHKRDYKLDEGRVYFHPHLQMNASEYARTKKVYALFRQQIKEKLGVEIKDDSTVYQQYILLLMEHLAREMKIGGDGVQFVVDKMLPLPKSEWIVNKRKAEKEDE